MKSRFRFPLWAKTLIVLILSVSLVDVVAVVFSATALRNITRNHYIEHAQEVADTYGLYLDVNDVKTLKNKVNEIYKALPEEERVNNTHWDEDEWTTYLSHYNEILESPEYIRLFDKTKEFHSRNDAKYVCLTYIDWDNRRVIYLIDDAPEDERCLPGSFDEFTESDMTIFDHLEEGFTPEISNTPEYGYLVSVGRPIFDGNEIIANAMVDLSMDKILTQENQEILKMSLILVGLSVAAVAIGYTLVSFLLIRPIRKLTKVANEYTHGANESLDKFSKVEINTHDEIKDLADSMKKMERDLNQFIGDLLSTTSKLEGAEKKAFELKRIADVDALTGVGNKRAYFEVEERINEAIKKGKAKFAISMIDLNDLKLTNDTFGHERGDNLIVLLAKIVKKIFPQSSIYRVGGDEFVVISEGDVVDDIFELEKKFSDTVTRTKKRNVIPVSAAIGTAVYDPHIDNNVEDVFKRADELMYEHKQKLKK